MCNFVIFLLCRFISGLAVTIVTVIIMKIIVASHNNQSMLFILKKCIDIILKPFNSIHHLKTVHDVIATHQIFAIVMP